MQHPYRNEKKLSSIPVPCPIIGQSSAKAYTPVQNEQRSDVSLYFEINALMKPLIRKAAEKRWEGEGKVLSWRGLSRKNSVNIAIL